MALYLKYVEKIIMLMRHSRDLNNINITGFKFDLYVIERTYISYTPICILHIIVEEHNFDF